MTVTENELITLVGTTAVTVFIVLALSMVLANLLTTMTEKRDISLYKEKFPDKE